MLGGKEIACHRKTAHCTRSTDLDILIERARHELRSIIIEVHSSHTLRVPRERSQALVPAVRARHDVPYLDRMIVGCREEEVSGVREVLDRVDALRVPRERVDQTLRQVAVEILRLQIQTGGRVHVRATLVVTLLRAVERRRLVLRLWSLGSFGILPGADTRNATRRCSAGEIALPMHRSHTITLDGLSLGEHAAFHLPRILVLLRLARGPRPTPVLDVTGIRCSGFATLLHCGAIVRCEHARVKLCNVIHRAVVVEDQRLRRARTGIRRTLHCGC